MTEQNEPDPIEAGSNSQAEDKEEDPEEAREAEPAHHARRPMNAFLIFCKRHRSVVREKHPNLENRLITKILGEWWKILEDDERQSYQSLAQMYKDAFLRANPNFKWYKLPAPPLRTLSTRPLSVLSNVSGGDENLSADDEKTNNNSTKIDYNKTEDGSGSGSSVFTPGKLADEAQMGGLSSLMLNLSPESQKNQFQSEALCTPKCQGIASGYDAPKPPRKRSVDSSTDNGGKYFQVEDELQNALSETSRILEKAFETEPANLFKVELDKNGDSFDKETEDQTNDLVSKEDYDDDADFAKDSKGSKRSCKGKRYREFMAFGGLYVNKRMKRDDNTPSCSWQNVDSPPPDESDGEETADSKDISTNETNKMFTASDFDLDAKIKALPSLSFDKFHLRKKQSKKRKTKPPGKKVQRPAEIFCSDNKVYIPQTTAAANSSSKDTDTAEQYKSAIIGSKKRKPRKVSITRLDVSTPKSDVIREQQYTMVQTEYTTSNVANNAMTLETSVAISEPNVDLCALETLAEVAANTSKIDENNEI